MKAQETNDKLKNLFHEVRTENPSTDFMESLMLRIEKEALAKRKKKYLLNYLLFASGIAGIFLIPALIIYFLDIQIEAIKLPNFSLEIQSIFENFSIDPMIIGLGLVVLLLLLGDSILRKISAH